MKAVLFDLDGTLLDRATSLVRFVRGQYERYEVLHSFVDEDAYVRSFVALDNGGHVWKDEVYRQLVEQYGIEGVTGAALLQDYVDGFAAACVGFPGMRDALEILKRQGYVLGMITNGRSPFQEVNIRALGIQSFFSVILVSGAVGMRKPDADIFLEALRLLAVAADEAVFIGDSAKADVAGAKGVGMKAVWKGNGRSHFCETADAICDDLMDLPDIIRQL